MSHSLPQTAAMTLSEFLLARIAYDEHGARILQEAGDDVHMAELRLGHRIVERVLAECDAKRQLIESPYDFDSVLRYLALPYADHADYREEWRP